MIAHAEAGKCGDYWGSLQKKCHACVLLASPSTQKPLIICIQDMSCLPLGPPGPIDPFRDHHSNRIIAIGVVLYCRSPGSSKLHWKPYHRWKRHSNDSPWSIEIYEFSILEFWNLKFWKILRLSKILKLWKFLKIL